MTGKLGSGGTSGRAMAFYLGRLGLNPGTDFGFKNRCQSILTGFWAFSNMYRVRARKWDTIIKFFRPILNSFHLHSFYIHVTSAHSKWLEKDLLYTRIGLGHIHSQELGVISGLGKNAQLAFQQAV